MILGMIYLVPGTWYDIQQCSSILYCYTFAIQNETYIPGTENREKREKQRENQRECGRLRKRIETRHEQRENGYDTAVQHL